MKKYFKFILLVSLLLVLPFKVYAVLEVDENGNPIEKELKPDEVTIMNIDEGQLPPDHSVSSDEELKRKEIENGNDSNEGKDIYYTTQENSVEADETLLTSKTDDKTFDQNLIYFIISGLAGISIGSIITYLIIKK